MALAIVTVVNFAETVAFLLAFVYIGIDIFSKKSNNYSRTKILFSSIIGLLFLFSGVVKNNAINIILAVFYIYLAIEKLGENSI